MEKEMKRSLLCILGGFMIGWIFSSLRCRSKNKKLKNTINEVRKNVN